MSNHKEFFEAHGTELVSLNGWLGEPRFTVEELYQAFKARVISDLESALVAEFGT